MLIVPKQCEVWLSKQRPQGDYQKDIQNDFETIEPFLPKKVGSILDIGCGMAGIDVFLKRKYPSARLELLDGDGKNDKYGFSPRYEPYSSKNATEAMLEANGIACDKWYEAGTTEALKADLIVSILSWGFHYPLSTYKVSEYCIADLRKGHEEPRGVVVYEALKYKRCAFTC